MAHPHGDHSSHGHDHSHDYGHEGHSHEGGEASGTNTSSASSAAGHRCIHDEPAFQRMLSASYHTVSQTYKSASLGGGRQRSSGPFAPQAAMDSHIRIVLSTLDVDDPTRYCSSAGQTGISNMQGGTVSACTDAQVLTAEKRSILLTKVLPAAMNILSGALLVDPVVGNLRVGSGCSTFTVPATHTQNGVPNADFVLYVAAAPTQPGNVAWAGACAFDGVGRPIVGRANFSPEYLVWGKPADERTLVRTAVHEILHAMGFSSGTFARLLSTETRRGASRKIVTSAGALAAARDHFDCQSLTGAEIEDEGGSGTAGSHWERRTHYDDVMAGIVGPDMFISAVTLGLLADLGFYAVDYTAAERPLWMRDAGCGVHASVCNTASGGMGRYFCDPTPSPSLATCDANFRSVGVCTGATYSSALNAWEQYFPSKGPDYGGTASLMNYCPIVSGYSNRACTSYTNAAANDTIQAYYYGSDGMCFNVAAGGVIKSGYTGGDVGTARCLQRRCVPNGASGQFVEFRVGENPSWIRCGSEGEVIPLASYGYSGSVICPSVATHCPPLEEATSTSTARPTTTTNAATTAGTTKVTTTGVTTTAATGAATTAATTKASTTGATTNAVTTGVATTKATTTGATTTTAATTRAPTPLPTIPTLPATPAPTDTPTPIPTVPPVDARPLAHVTYLLFLTIAGARLPEVISGPAASAFRAALEADVADRLDLVATVPAAATFTGSANAARGSIVLDRHVPFSSPLSASATADALALRFLVSTPALVTGFALTLWLNALNASATAQTTATWMARAQDVYSRALGGPGYATPSPAPTAGGALAADPLPEATNSDADALRPFAAHGAVAPFTVADPRFSDPQRGGVDDALLTDCGALGCVATASVATVGGWAAVILVALAVYQTALFCFWGDGRARNGGRRPANANNRSRGNTNRNNNSNKNQQQQQPRQSDGGDAAVRPGESLRQLEAHNSSGPEGSGGYTYNASRPYA